MNIRIKDEPLVLNAKSFTGMGKDVGRLNVQMFKIKMFLFAILLNKPIGPRLANVNDHDVLVMSERLATKAKAGPHFQ